MKCKKIRIEFKRCERERFYRVFLVKKDLELKKLACAILLSFKTDFQPTFFFKINNNLFVSKYLYDERKADEFLLDDYDISVLGQQFEFIYNNVDCWEFSGEISGDEFELDGEEVVVLERAGQGIWELNQKTFFAYLNGEIKNDYGDDNYSLPWNLECEKFSDFDTKNDSVFEVNAFYKTYLACLDIYFTYIDIPENPDDYFDDFILEEDMELLDEFDEDSDENEVIEETVKIVNEHIFIYDFVEETFIRLLENHSEDETKKLIAHELVNEMFKAAIYEKELDLESYKNALAKIK